MPPKTPGKIMHWCWRNGWNRYKSANNLPTMMFGQAIRVKG
jgi:hypothetical protein